MKTITITIQVGNTDDKLTQERWARFVEHCEIVIKRHSSAIHFSACLDGRNPWQNAAWVIKATPENAALLRKAVAFVRAGYGQDSAAWTEGETEFV